MQPWWALGVAIALGGCLRDPVRNAPVDADPGDDASDASTDDGRIDDVGPRLAVETSPRVTISRSDVEMAFALDFDHLLVSARLGETELVAGGACPEQHRDGLGFFPAAIISGSDGAMQGAVRGGPLVTQVVVPIRQLIECSAMDETTTLAGEVRYTVFVDGRIHRHDELVVPSDVSASCLMCGSGDIDTSPIVVSSYTRFRSTVAGAVSPASPAVIGTELATAESTFCVPVDERAVIVGFSPDGIQRRVRSFGGGGVQDSVAVAQELASGELISAGALTSRTTMLISADGACEPHVARAAALAAGGPPLRINTVATPLGPDGLYSAGRAAILALGGFTLAPESAPIPGGFAVWANVGSAAVDKIRARRSDGTQTPGWVRVQDQGSGSLIFYFRDDLPADATIEVTVVPASEQR